MQPRDSIPTQFYDAKVIVNGHDVDRGKTRNKDSYNSSITEGGLSEYMLDRFSMRSIATFAESTMMVGWNGSCRNTILEPTKVNCQ